MKSADERLQCWGKHFQLLLDCGLPRGPEAAFPYIDPPSTPMLDEEPSIDEIKFAVRSLKDGKAPGWDQVTSEVVKAGGDVLISHLHSLIRLNWKSECFP